MSELPPNVLAEFDQAMTATTDVLAQAVASYVQRRREDEACGLPEPVTIMALMDALISDWPQEACQSALCAAIVALAYQAEVAHGR